MNFINIYKYEKNNSKDFIKRIALFILISLTIFQLMPLIKDKYYNQIRILLYIGFGLISVISLLSIKQYIKIHFVKYFILTIIYTFLLLILTITFEKKLANISELLVPFGIFVCSLSTNFNNKQLSFTLLWYVLLSVILGLSSIFYYGSGFAIVTRYFLDDKNSIGPLLGISSIIAGIWLLDKEQFGLKINVPALAKITLLIMLISSILIIRNRSGLLAIFITLIFAAVKKYKLKVTIRNILYFQTIVLILFALFLFGIFDEIVDVVFKSLFLNYDITDLNSVSAGRIDVYILALKFVKKYPIIGRLGYGRFINSTPHNYILNKWVNFGIIGSFPLVLFYLYLYFITIKGIWKRKNKKVFTLPLWTLLYSLFVSNFEYTYPYGPGVSQLMVWFLLGQYFRRNYDELF